MSYKLHLLLRGAFSTRNNESKAQLTSEEGERMGEENRLWAESKKNGSKLISGEENVKNRIYFFLASMDINRTHSKVFHI